MRSTLQLKTMIKSPVTLVLFMLLVIHQQVLLVGAAEADKVDFAREVRPILARHCFACHGPDQGQRKAKLRLDQKADAFADRGGWSPVFAGNVGESEIIARITSHDKDEVMPPGGPEKRLKPEEIATLSRWIGQGGIRETGSESRS